MALAGEIDVSTSTKSRKFYLVGQGPVGRFNELGADGLLEPPVAAVAFDSTGHFGQLDTFGHLI